MIVILQLPQDDQIHMETRIVLHLGISGIGRWIRRDLYEIQLGKHFPFVMEDTNILVGNHLTFHVDELFLGAHEAILCVYDTLGSVIHRPGIYVRYHRSTKETRKTRYVLVIYNTSLLNLYCVISLYCTTSKHYIHIINKDTGRITSFEAGRVGICNMYLSLSLSCLLLPRSSYVFRFVKQPLYNTIKINMSG